MEVEFALQAKDDLAYWRKTNNIVVLKKIRKIIESIIETPFEGLGRPEPLKHNLSGCWSRRINQTDRMVYEIGTNKIFILSLKGHY